MPFSLHAPQKKKGAIELRDYRPTSLIRSVYNIAAKVLAEKLKRVINKRVSDQQSADRPLIPL